MPSGIVLLWCAGIAVKAVAAYRIAVKGLFDRLPIFWTFVVVSAARSVALFAVRADSVRYAELAAVTKPMMLLSEGLAIASVFWLVTENFPRWRKPGTISLAVLTLLGTAAAWLLRNAGVPADWRFGWADAWEAAVVVERNAMAGMAVALAGTRVLLSIARMVPVRPTARRAADVLSIHVLLNAAGAALTIWVGRRFPMLAFAWPACTGLVTGLLCAFWLPAASDVCPRLRSAWAIEEDFRWREAIAEFLGRMRPGFVARPR